MAESPISRIMAVVTASVLILSACGGGDRDASPVSPTGRAAEPAAATTSAPFATTTTTTMPTTTTTGVPETRVVTPGAEVLAAADFDLLAGRRVGLIANHTSLVGDARLIDLLAAHPAVELAAIFAPEHGVTGTADAGELVDDGADPLVDVPVFSLYGETRQPTPEMLAGLDVLVYDLQDVGTRFYTYISTMGLAMQAAVAAGLPFVVLDRPNPLGGQLVAGFVRTEARESFIGQYPIPSVYGLTAGELAEAIRGEGWLAGLADLDLTVVEIDGWRRAHRWPDTGLEWTPPSPGLPGFASAAAYPGTVLFEATSISYGRGTREPFAVIGAPWADGAALVLDLESRSLPGVTFERVSFTPEVLDIAPTPRLLGVPLVGVRIVVTDPGSFDPVAVGVHLMEAFQTQADAGGAGDIIDRADTFDLLAGTSELRRLLESGVPATEIVSAWQDDVEEFAPVRERYLRYGP